MSTFGLSKIHCPCRMCGNLYQFNLNYVPGYLYRWGISKLYKVWTFHGEMTTPIVDMDLVNEVEHVSDDEKDDTFFDMLNNLRDAKVVGSSGVQRGDNNENMPAKELGGKLYSGCTNFSAFSFLVKLMHVKVLNSWSNKSFDMLLQLLGEAFPKPNAIPRSHYEAKKMLRELGLGYESIHACKHDCILFWNDHEGKDTCLVCKEPHYKVNEANKKKIPQKVFRYFPLKPRLKRLFLSKHTAKDMRWHKEKRVETDGILRYLTDVESWKEFDKLHEILADDPRNVHLGLATNGFNPFGNMSNAYSMWPVLLMLYNLPPWKMTKPSYMIMSLLIPGPKAPEKEIDVYLRPLINELKELLDDGVETYDASTERVFQLHVAMMWIIYDFPVYGTVSGWSTKDYKACLVCLEDTTSQDLHSKICYTGYCQFLYLKHSWRKNKSFNGKFENEGPPQTFSGREILMKLDALPEVIFSKHPALIEKRKQKRKHLVGDTNWVKKLIFFELEYWSHLKLRHNLDVMHIEKNICDTLVGTLLSLEGKSKDTIKARLDMQDMGIRSELHLSQSEDRVTKPHASYTFTLEERREFCHFLKSVKFPDGYAVNISRNVNVNDGKLYGLKTHDCHVLLQRLLLVAIRKFLPKDNMGQLLNYAILGGPISSWWMYPFERYLGTLKKYVRNKVRLEGSIAEGYIVNEALTFTSLYMVKLKQDLLDQNVTKMLRTLKDPEATNELYSLALGLDIEVILYDACIIDGVWYHIISRDTRRTTQNSGISIPSFNDGENLDFFGVLKDVIILFYASEYKVHLFWCDWFQCNPKKINRARVWSYIQVYYLDDIKCRGSWKVVQKVQYREIYKVIEKEDDNSDELEL
ncbi:hypothetical protein Pfo_010004 [Paulownia fortunei]|nr:hypothetical protein Pfo_010004 [Paulownia fortunei]